MRLALAASVAVHVGVLAWASGIGHRASARKPTLPPPAEQEAEPVDVVLLEDHAPVATTTRDGGLPSQASHHHVGSSRIATAPEVRATRPEAPAAGHSKLLAMRGPEAANLELPESFSDRPDPLAASRQPLAASSGELHPSGGGHYTSEHGAFTAHVNPDGTAHFDDKPDIDLKPSCLFAGCPMSFDDALMRRHGIDPYASAKRQWLEKTFDERAALGLAHRKDELARSAEYMQKNLAWMWQKTNDPIERKQALFELWDEVAESGDDDLVTGGKAARDYLVGFVRSHLPEGSPGAFTHDELAELNAHRKSHAVFAPY